LWPGFVHGEIAAIHDSAIEFVDGLLRSIDRSVRETTQPKRAGKREKSSNMVIVAEVVRPDSDVVGRQRETPLKAKLRLGLVPLERMRDTQHPLRPHSAGRVGQRQSDCGPALGGRSRVA